MIMKAGDKVLLSLGSGIPDKNAIVLETMSGLTKVKWFYPNIQGNEMSADGWYKNKYIKQLKSK
jgi:hypothetical protein